MNVLKAFACFILLGFAYGYFQAKPKPQLHQTKIKSDSLDQMAMNLKVLHGWLEKSRNVSLRLENVSEASVSENQLLSQRPEKKVKLNDLALSPTLIERIKKQRLAKKTNAKNESKHASKASSTSGAMMSQEEEKNESEKPKTFDYRVVEYRAGLNSKQEVNENQFLSMSQISQRVVGQPDFSLFENDVQDDRILSLGNHGIITLEVVNGYVHDQEGPDFIVFENPFVSLSSNEVFAETAVVSVALNNDDKEYVQFRCNSTQSPYQGCAGVSPVAFDESVPIMDVGGDAFDLSDLGLNKIKYIRITDTGENPMGVLNKEGFDLDAIALVNTSKE